MRALLVVAVLLGFGTNALPGEKSISSEQTTLRFPKNGKVVMYGGDGPTDLIPASDLLEFIEREAAGTEVIYIPTAYRKWTEQLGVEKAERWSAQKIQLRYVHAESREKALEEALAAPLKKAKVAYLGGGEQDYLAERYVGTPMLRELKALVERGGTLVGSSAGMAAMPNLAIHDQIEINGAKEVVTGDGLDIFSGVITETHYLQRNRRWRVDQIQQRFPMLHVFAVDKRAAVVLSFKESDVHAEVLGESEAHYFPPAAGADSQHLVLKKGSDKFSLTMK